MQSREVLTLLLKSYSGYYDVNFENPTPPFAAEASFCSVGEHYFLTHSAKLAEEESSEHVFFFLKENEVLGEADVARAARAAWETGLGRVKPHGSHRNTDITVIYLADKISEDALKAVKKLKFYKSYKWGFHGWSAFRAAVLETDSYKTAFNGRGSSLKAFFKKFIASVQKANK